MSNSAQNEGYETTVPHGTVSHHKTTQHITTQSKITSHHITSPQYLVELSQVSGIEILISEDTINGEVLDGLEWALR
jgi:hypothetical protein